MENKLNYKVVSKIKFGSAFVAVAIEDMDTGKRYRAYCSPKEENAELIATAKALKLLINDKGGIENA